MLSADWHYTQNGQQHGPVTAAELKTLVQTGKLTPTDMVWKAGMAEWKVASSIKGLFPIPGPVPAPASEVQPPTPASSPAPVSSFPNKALFSFVDKVKEFLGKVIGPSVPDKQTAAISFFNKNRLWFGVGGAAVACIVLVLFVSIAGKLQQNEKNNSTSNITLQQSIEPNQNLKSLTNSIGIKLMQIPKGKFIMGSPESEEGRDKGETQHQVTISQGFYMGSTEVTQAQWQKVMGNKPSQNQTEGGELDDELPVVYISWEEAVDFCKRLSEMPEEKKAGRKYRLPTEAEWEYACRAGTTTPYHFGSELNGSQANCNGTDPYGTETEGPYLKKITIVGKYPANAWGLYDMHGNVWECCADWYGDYPTGSVTDPSGPVTGSSCVRRGGGWSFIAVVCRSANRFGVGPSLHTGYLGFRVVMTSSENPK